jgi:hypothetical protein
MFALTRRVAASDQIGQGNTKLAQPLLIGEQFWSLPGYLKESRRFLEQALEVSEEIQPSVSPAVRAKALYAAGGWHTGRSTQDTLRLCWKRACDSSAHWETNEASALTCLSTIFHDRNEGGTATALLKKCFKLYRETGENSELTERVVSREAAEASPATLTVNPTVLPVRSTEPLCQ